jgi:hypothetical protein
MQRDAIGATLLYRVFLPLVNAQLDDDNPEGRDGLGKRQLCTMSV